MKIIETNTGPQFTLPLSRFIRYLIKSAERSTVDLMDAELIKELDKDEQYCHVQFTDLYTNAMLPKPIVWYIKDWRSSYLKYQLDKAKSEKERRESCLLRENRERVLQALLKNLDINDPSIIDPKILNDLALKIAKIKDDSVASKTLGVKIDKGEE